MPTEEIALNLRPGEATDEEIVKKICIQTNLAVGLRIYADQLALRNTDDPRIDRLRKAAGMIIVHVLKLVATHRLAVARWMESRKQPPVR